MTWKGIETLPQCKHWIIRPTIPSKLKSQIMLTFCWMKLWNLRYSRRYLLTWKKNDKQLFFQKYGSCVHSNPLQLNSNFNFKFIDTFKPPLHGVQNNDQTKQPQIKCGEMQRLFKQSFTLSIYWLKIEWWDTNTEIGTL